MKNDLHTIDINYTKVKLYIESRRPRIDVRNEIDYGFIHYKNTYELYVIRPVWGSSDKNQYRKSPYAKIRYIRTQKVWKLYWQRASGKWEGYDPLSGFSNIDSALKCIEKDLYGCFYG